MHHWHGEESEENGEEFFYNYTAKVIITPVRDNLSSISDKLLEDRFQWRFDYTHRKAGLLDASMYK